MNFEFEIAKKAENLLAKMTLTEKVGQLNQKLFGWEAYRKDQDGFVLTDKFKDEVKKYGGIGVLYGVFRADPWSKVTFENGIRAIDAPKVANKIQKYVLENTRLSIPVLLSTECPHGHQALDGYLLPVNLALGASFNHNLAAKGFEKVAMQCRAMGAHLALISMLDVLREPRWGRSEECYGEDPYLCAQMAQAIVKAVQGNGKEDLSRPDKMAVIAKHFCAQGACTGGINLFPACIGERELREIHLPAMKKCCEANVAGCMAAYNEIDGIPCHANERLLNGILRHEFGFDGVVMADGGAVDRLDMQTGDTVKSGALALKSGVDISLWDDGFTLLEKAVEKGYLDESAIDAAVLRVLSLKYKLGLFDNPFVDENNSVLFAVNHTRDEASLDIARESVVLLENRGNILPLNSNIKTIAVIGPNADNLYNQMGDYTPPMKANQGITLLKAIKDTFSGEVLFAKGCDILSDCEDDFDNAVNAAKRADVVILALGGSSARDFGVAFDFNGAAIPQDGNNMDCGEGVDVADLNISRIQQKLFDLIYSHNQNIITVLIQGRPYAVSGIAEKSKGLLCAFYPGPMGGRAIAEILFGKICPSGKLPVTIPRSSAQLPVYYNHKNTGYEPHYIDMDKPLYNFGYGLSYTSFRYGKPEIINGDITCRDILNGEKIKIRVEITNTGDFDGAEAAQLYIRDCEASVTRRVIELKGYQKVFIKKKSTATIIFELGFEELAIWDSDMNFTVEPGRFIIYIGGDSKTDNSISVTLD